jgi:head-tail adaptor
MAFLTDHFFSESITLQRPTITQDELGGSIRTWADVLDASTIPASIQPLSTSEKITQGTRLLGVTHQIYIQAEPIFKRGDRVRTKRGDYYRIVGIRNEILFDKLWVLDAREILK